MKLDLRMPSLEKLKPRRRDGGGGKGGLSVPAPVRDLYGDLRDRRLLPLMAFLLVAILAVPFLLGGGDDLAPPPPAPTAEADAGDRETLAVVQATPGLRDYHERLQGRKPKDPFKQQQTGVPAGAKLQATTSPAPSVTEVESPEGLPLPTEPAPTPAPAPGPSGPAGPGAGTGDGKPHGRLFGYRPKVRFGQAGSGDLSVYDELPIGKLLPAKQPVVVFLGVSEDGKRATFNVAPEVSFVRGGGRCIGGQKNCGILLLKRGEAVDLLTGRPNRDFRLKLQDIEFVELEEMTKANTSAANGTSDLAFSQSFSK